MISAPKVFNALFDGLAPRQKEVVGGRFGLSGGDGQTLAALGKRYGVTRERVRQIETGSLALLKKRIKSTPACTDILNLSQKYLRSVGGVARKEALLAHHKSLIDGLTHNHLALLLEATDAFYSHGGDSNFSPFYYLDKESLKKASDFIGQFSKSLKAHKEDILNGGYEAHLANFVHQKKIENKLAGSYLGISRKIGTNPYGDIGLADWAEIRPRTIRDRIYLVLKKKGEPLHFETIAHHINEVGFGGRKALAPTVHNELIKDSRFVLVGRGIYALAEQGYEPGTAKEVIHRILKKQGAMTYQDIVMAVQKDRFFKPNTILANLQNKDLFERLRTGTYRVREA